MPPLKEPSTRDQVARIIDSVIGKVEATHEVPREVICRELGDLKQIIDSLRQHLQTAAPGALSQTHIATAKDELDAVVQATEQATNTIMTACEAIQEQIAAAPASIAGPVGAEIVRIFEACTFQDITGQRISKVIKTLKQIDAKVSGLLDVIGAPADVVPDEPAPVSLLNGPQMPQDAVSQDEIDRLMSSF